VYRKGELLYNLDAAKGTITRTSEVVVVEGYTDVIALAIAGVENAVASCGTALTESHLRTLARFAQRAVLTFDADEAGARAAERAFAFHETAAIQPVVLILPEGQDPADFARANGGDAFRALAATALPLVEYMIRRTVGRMDLSGVEGRTRAVDEAFPIVAQLTDPVRRQEYAHLLAEVAGVSESSVMLKLQGQARGDQRGSSQTAARREAAAKERDPRKRLGPQELVEREMLKLLARDPQAWTLYGSLVTPDHFTSEANRQMLVTLASAGGDVQALIAGSEDDALVGRLSELAVEPLEGEPTADYAANVWIRLQEFALQRRSADMRRDLQKLNPTTDERYDRMFQELIALDGELRRLRQAPDRGPEPAS
jgi:DNA primase